MIHQDKLTLIVLQLLLVHPGVSSSQHRRQKVLIPVEDRVGEEVSKDEVSLFWSRFLQEQSSSIAPPSPSPVEPSCTPTTGACVSSQATFESALRGEIDNQDQVVVAMCGDTTIETFTATGISQSNLMLCCASENCVFRSHGMDRNLYMTGTHVTLRGIRFVGGGGVESGGNVAIETDGNVTVEDCVFSNGTSRYLGGNLYVKTSGSVLVSNTIIETGQVGNGGGALGVLDARQVDIVDTTMRDNVAGSDGGGFIIFGGGQEFDQKVQINNSSFLRNEAIYGGGFLATSFGRMPSLHVQLSTFNDNVAQEGAAATVFHNVIADIPPLDLVLQGNVGSGNTASSFCDDFLVFPDCFNVSHYYP